MTTPARRTPRSPQPAALAGATDAYGLPVEAPKAPAAPTSVTPPAKTTPPRATTVSVRLSGDLLDRFERWADQHRWSRGRAATVAIERVLDQADTP